MNVLWNIFPRRKIFNNLLLSSLIFSYKEMIIGLDDDIQITKSDFNFFSMDTLETLFFNFFFKSFCENKKKDCQKMMNKFFFNHRSLWSVIKKSSFATSDERDLFFITYSPFIRQTNSDTVKQILNSQRTLLCSVMNLW